MNQSDDSDEDSDRLPGGRRESDSEALRRVGLADSRVAHSRRGHVAGSGYERALAGMTDTAPEKADLSAGWCASAGWNPRPPKKPWKVPLGWPSAS